MFENTIRNLLIQFLVVIIKLNVPGGIEEMIMIEMMIIKEIEHTMHLLLI